MRAYDRKAQDKKSRAFIMKEAQNLLEASDLFSLTTVHDLFGFGKIRLERCYRGFQETYDVYKGKYLTKDDSVVCGDRTDTYALKMHLSWLGFDYDELDTSKVLVLPSLRSAKNEKQAKLMRDRAIVLKEALPVMEHANLIFLKTIHDGEKFGKRRMELYFKEFQSRYSNYKMMYLLAHEDTISGAIIEKLKNNLLKIGYDYDAVVYDLLDEYRRG